MLTVFKRPSIVVEAQKAKFKPNIIIQTLIFIVVFLHHNYWLAFNWHILCSINFQGWFSGNIPLDPLETLQLSISQIFRMR